VLKDRKDEGEEEERLNDHQPLTAVRVIRMHARKKAAAVKEHQAERLRPTNHYYRAETAAAKVPTSFDIREEQRWSPASIVGNSCNTRGVKFRPAASAKYWETFLVGWCGSRGLRYGKQQGDFFS
jgi:hypothetical protein